MEKCPGAKTQERHVPQPSRAYVDLCTAVLARQIEMGPLVRVLQPTLQTMQSGSWDVG